MDPLPKCHLTDRLASVAQQAATSEFDPIPRLQALRMLVRAECKYIQLLFPQYTPHDAEEHLDKLLPLACTLLGKKPIDGYNVAELYVLLVGLYAHDWGMAVSHKEREYICTRRLPEGKNAGDFALLKNEHEQFAIFARAAGLVPKDDGSFEPSHDVWSRYVRATHALRSGQRVVKYFADVPDVGIAAQAVCEGHWLDPAKLTSDADFPVDYALFGCQMNLRAVAVYVRLVDLLHLTADRTPYHILQFIAPNDPVSKLEWEKHRAIHSFGCTEFHGGRRGKFQGLTDDPDVYAAIKDLERYVEDQLRQCRDVLVRHPDRRHTLDVESIDWKITAKGFAPVVVRFDFDRAQMFRLLSDDIYRGDHCVFLRELVQNAIDAVHLREQLCAKAGITFVPRIDVAVSDNPDGSIEVRVTDNGAGMDEYIVRNYLAMAGRSYYRSEDFRKLGVEMDPISRFGIGLLSCFMVASSVQIETHRETAHCTPDQRKSVHPLQITVHDVARHFHVRQPDNLPVGTTVTVRVDRSLLPRVEGKPAEFDAAGYLADVFAFTRVPIVINDGGVLRVILHAEEKPEASLRRLQLPEGTQTSQLSLAGGLEQFFVPQDLDKAARYFDVEGIDIRNDLGISGIEGWIKTLKVRPGFRLSASTMPTVHGSDGTQLYATSGRYVVLDDSDHPPSRKRVCDYRAVYLRGVLLAGEGLDRAWSRTRALPRAHINLLGHEQVGTDAARRDLRIGDDDWIALVIEKLGEFLATRVLQGVSEAERLDRLYLTNMLWLGIDRPSGAARWPMETINRDGYVEAVNYEALPDAIIAIPDLSDWRTRRSASFEYDVDPTFSDHVRRVWNAYNGIRVVCGQSGLRSPDWRKQIVWIDARGLGGSALLAIKWTRTAGEASTLTIPFEEGRFVASGAGDLPAGQYGSHWFTPFAEPLSGHWRSSGRVNSLHPAGRELARMLLAASGLAGVTPLERGIIGDLMYSACQSFASAVELQRRLRRLGLCLGGFEFGDAKSSDLLVLRDDALLDENEDVEVSARPTTWGRALTSVDRGWILADATEHQGA